MGSGAAVHREFPNHSLQAPGQLAGGQNTRAASAPAQTDTSAVPAAPLSQPSLQSFHAARIGSYQLHKGRMGDKGQGCSGCPVSPTWPVQHEAATAAPGIQTQLLGHRSDAPSFPLSQSTGINSVISAVSINWKVPLIMCQSKSATFDSTD